MLAVQIKDDPVVVSRHFDSTTGPSLQYELQESVFFHGFLDELETLAYGEGNSLEPEDRLIVPASMHSFEDCRKTLPARRG